MDEEFLGMIKLFAGNYVPAGFALCDGRKISINSNQPLFAILGTKYGGDGINDFALPDLRPANKEYTVRNTEVKRSHESGDPGNFAYLGDSVVIKRETQREYMDEPMYIICVSGLWPDRQD